MSLLALLLMAVWGSAPCLFALAPMPSPSPSLPRPGCRMEETEIDGILGNYTVCYQSDEVDAAHAIIRHFQQKNRGINFTTQGWSNETMPCDWNFLECDMKLVQRKDTFHYESFISSWYFDESLELVGNFPIEFGILDNLKSLLIGQQTKLSGSIPSSIFSFQQLERLLLSGNNLSGNLPIDMFSKRNAIIHLDLSNNHFSGVIPYIDYIQLLDLRQNKFSTISNDWCYYHTMTFSISSYLDLSNNTLIGTFCVWEFGRFEVINISKNQFIKINTSNVLPKPNSPQRLYTRKFWAQDNSIVRFPYEVLQWPTLEIIYLDNNQISGSLDLLLLSAENSSLKVISLINNKIDNLTMLNGSLLDETHLRNSEVFIFLGGNPICKKSHQDVLKDLFRYLCRYNKTSIIPDLELNQRSPGDKKLSKILIAVIASTSSAIVFVLSIIIAHVMRKLVRQKIFLQDIQKEFSKKEIKPYLYSHSELKLATQDFSANNVLGAGGYGVVYKGILGDGSAVAIKRLKIKTDQALQDFLNEIVVISSIKHRNLVQLKGCCITFDERILVYEFVDNKNLAEALWEEPLELNWATRFNIILGIARGLSYLHEDVQPAIIHRDIKPPNILLDKDLNPKIVDFGLAFLFPNLINDQTHESVSKISGTRGYLAPEYASFGQVSTKLDVFSFGILILEIVGGRKNIDLEMPTSQRYLLDWAYNLHETNRMSELMDVTILDSTDTEDSIKRVLRMGLWCAQHTPAKRPSMSQVVDMLLNDKEIPDIYCNIDEYKERRSDIELESMSSLQTVQEDNSLFQDDIIK